MKFNFIKKIKLFGLRRGISKSSSTRKKTLKEINRNGTGSIINIYSISLLNSKTINFRVRT